MARWQYQSKAEPVSTSHESILPDKWLPSYSDTFPKTKIQIAAIQSGSSSFVYTPAAVETITIDKWLPNYPSQLFSLRKPRYETGSVGPIVPQIFVDQWLPTYPVRLDPPKKSFWGGEYNKDNRPVIQVDSWLPTYPSRIDGRRPNAQDYLVNPWLSHIPSAEILTMDKWSPSYPSRLDRAGRIFWKDWSVTDVYLDHIPPVVIAASIYPQGTILGYNPMGYDGPTIGGGW